jgi:hypothetical protein
VVAESVRDELGNYGHTLSEDELDKALRAREAGFRTRNVDHLELLSWRSSTGVDVTKAHQDRA